MRRVFTVLIAALWLLGPGLPVLGTEAEIDLAEQAGRMVEYLVLESGMGVRWEPAPGDVKRLRAALDRPWEELVPLKAPFARSDGEVVTTEALAWTILAEIAYARQLATQGAPEALIYVYLASAQVGFAREELLDPATGLYRPRWHDGEAFGEPTLRDQLLMLWALSNYSAIGDLLASGSGGKGRPESAQLFRRQIAPLADELFQALQPELTAAKLSDRDRRLRVEALRAYRDATGDSELAREAERDLGPPGFAPSTPPVRPVRDARASSLQLETLADWLATAAPLDMETLQKDPAVRRLVGSGVPWPATVAYDATSKTWQVEDPTLKTAGAMAVAFRLLTLRPLSPATGGALARLARRLASLNEELGTRAERLASFSEPQAEAVPEGTPTTEGTGTRAYPSAAPHALTLWEMMVLGATALVSVGVVLLARRGTLRSLTPTRDE